MRLTIPRGRLESRRALLAVLDGAKRALADGGAADLLGRYEQQAFDLILRTASKDRGTIAAPTTIIRMDESARSGSVTI